MPLPKPNRNEDRESFMQRCMANDTMNSEYPDEEQRAAVCSRQYEGKSKDTYMIRKTEYKTKLEDIDEDNGVVKVAINAIGNVDKQGDRSEQGSFKKTLQELGMVYHYLNHDTNKLIGVPIEGKEDGRYAVITSKLNLDKEIGRDVYSDYKLFAEQDKTLRHSIGAFPVKYEFEEGENEEDEIRVVKEWKLMEFSTLTMWPANDDTPMLDIKNMSNEDLEATLKSANEYLQTISKKGYHTDEYIRSVEKQVNQLTETIQTIRNSQNKTEPQAHSVVETIQSINVKNYL